MPSLTDGFQFAEIQISHIPYFNGMRISIPALRVFPRVISYRDFSAIGAKIVKESRYEKSFDGEKMQSYILLSCFRSIPLPFIELIALRTPLVILSSTCDTLAATRP